VLGLRLLRGCDGLGHRLGEDSARRTALVDTPTAAAGTEFDDQVIAQPPGTTALSRLKFPAPATVKRWGSDAAGHPVLVAMADPVPAWPGSRRPYSPSCAILSGTTGGSWAGSAGADLLHHIPNKLLRLREPHLVDRSRFATALGVVSMTYWSSPRNSRQRTGTGLAGAVRAV
jgi:hypothetical protein